MNSDNNNNPSAALRPQNHHQKHKRPFFKVAQLKKPTPLNRKEPLSKTEPLKLSTLDSTSKSVGMPPIERLSISSQKLTATRPPKSQQKPKRKPLFPPHEQLSALLPKLQPFAKILTDFDEPIYVKGIAFMHPTEPSRCYVSDRMTFNDDEDTDEHLKIRLPTHRHCNRALYKDIVIVRVEPRNKETKDCKKELVGHVVAIEKPFKCNQVVIGCVVQVEKWGNMTVLKPRNNKLPYIIISSNAIVGLIVLVEITQWLPTQFRPHGKIVKRLGKVQDKSIAIEIESIMHQFKLETIRSIPPKGLTDAYLNGIPREEIKNRLDLTRESCVFTVDPETARDLDDAISIQPSVIRGEFTVGVHIADVSHFVRPSTPLDFEAKKKTTSFYLVDRVISMLPEILSSNLCSLLPGEDRLTFSVFWNVKLDGTITNFWFGKTVIQSCAKLSYEDAMQVIEGKKLPENLNLKPRIANRKRFEQGALSLESLKLKFELDEEGIPTKCAAYPQTDAHRMIEELMLLANKYVAETIHTHYPNIALLRQHNSPFKRRLEEFKAYCESIGINMDISTSATVHASIEAIKENEKRKLLKLSATRYMRSAEYIISSKEQLNYTHYALAMPLYTHFTSPIRRYADIIVHRLLDTLNYDEQHKPLKTWNNSLVAHMNEQKAVTRELQKVCGNTYAAFLIDRMYDGSVECDGWIAEIQVSENAKERQSKLKGMSGDLGVFMMVFVYEFGVDKKYYFKNDENVEKVEMGNSSVQVWWKGGGLKRVEVMSKVRILVKSDFSRSPPTISVQLAQ